MIRMLVCPDMPLELDECCRRSAVLMVVSRLDWKFKSVEIVPRELVLEEGRSLEAQYPPEGFYVVYLDFSSAYW
jgi:hypothetical protein